jgi:hypothetical protein
LDGLDSEYPVNWIELHALPSIVLRCTSGDWNFLQLRRRVQLCVESRVDQQVLWELLCAETSGCYPGMKMRLSNSISLPAEKRILDPLKTTFICERRRHEASALAFSLASSIERRSGQWTTQFHCLLEDLQQEEVLMLEELSCTENDLLIYYSSEPVQHRQLRRLRRLCSRQVLIVAEKRNMRQLHSGF